MGLDVAGVGAVADFATNLVNKFWPDKTALEKDSLTKEVLTLTQSYNLVQGQLDINKIEAASTNWFIAGWRPAVGWIGALALAYSTFIEPTLRFIATVLFGYSGTFPVIDTSLTLQVLGGVLGLGALRTVEKYTGSEAKR